MVRIAGVALGAIGAAVATVFLPPARVVNRASELPVAAPVKKLRIASEKLVSQIRPSDLIESLASSPDARRVAYVARAGATQCVVVDGKRGKCYEAIGNRYDFNLYFEHHPYWGGPLFSPDGRRVAYVARNAEKWFVVVDGEEDSPYSDINLGSLTFSPDGQRLAYVIGAGLDQSVVVDGKKEKPYYSISGVRFSADGRNIAYWAGVRGWRLVVLNGREGKPYQGRAPWYFDGNKKWVGFDMHGLAFSPDSRQIAYSASFGPGSKLFEGKFTYNENEFIVVNGKEQENRHLEIYDGPIFSPDSRRLMYTAYDQSSPDGDRYGVVVVDETEQKHYDEVRMRTLHFSPDSERVAYWARVGKQWFVVADGKEEGPYDYMEIPEDWSSVATRGPIFSPDSRRTAYATKIGTRWFVVVDGKQEGPYDGIVNDPVFSPDSQFVAYGAKLQEKYFVVAGGKKSKAHDDLVRPDYALARPTIDVTPTIVFDSAKAFHYLAIRNVAKRKDVYLVEQTVD